MARRSKRSMIVVTSVGADRMLDLYVQASRRHTLAVAFVVLFTSFYLIAYGSDRGLEGMLKTVPAYFGAADIQPSDAQRLFEIAPALYFGFVIWSHLAYLRRVELRSHILRIDAAVLKEQAEAIAIELHSEQCGTLEPRWQKLGWFLGLLYRAMSVLAPPIGYVHSVWAALANPKLSTYQGVAWTGLSSHAWLQLPLLVVAMVLGTIALVADVRRKEIIPIKRTAKTN